jgi:diguanylate cyclase (GGDEF)-like protein
MTVPQPMLAPAAAGLGAELDVLEEDRGHGQDTAAILAAAVELERVAQARGDAVARERARLLQADMQERHGQTTRSVTLLWDVHAWATANDCRPVLARSHLLLARTQRNLGDMAACLEHSIRATEYLEEEAPVGRRVFFLTKLADALGWTGSFAAARERYRQAEQIATVAGDYDQQMMVLNNLAYTEYEAGEPRRAWAVVERMQAFAAAHGRQFSANKLDTVARIQIALGWYAQAERTVQQAIAAYTADPYEEVDALPEYLLTLGMAQRGSGAVEEAQETLERSRVLCDQRALGDVQLRVLEEQAELYASTGDYRRAYETQKAWRTTDEVLRSAQREAQARTRQAIFETDEARREAERFRAQARSDALTGLPNRRYVDEELPAVLGRAEAAGVPVTVALADLDHFKRINDTLSHEVGDLVLSTVGGLLRSGVAGISRSAFAARLGGEEFLVVLPGTAPDEAQLHLEALRLLVRSHPWVPITGGLPVTISIGATIAVAPGIPTQAALLAGADRSLYAAKRAGRDRVVVDQ